MSHRFTIDALRELIAARREGEQGMRLCLESMQGVEHVRTERLRLLLLSHLHESGRAVRELQSLVRALGGDPEPRAQTPEAIASKAREIQARIARVGRSPAAEEPFSPHGALACNQDGVILEECERGESRALEVYRNALDDPLPGLVRAIVLRQFEEVMSNHDQIRDLRGGLPRLETGVGNGAQAGQL